MPNDNNSKSGGKITIIVLRKNWREIGPLIMNYVGTSRKSGSHLRVIKKD
jgi:hypothetical protein